MPIERYSEKFTVTATVTISHSSKTTCYSTVKYSTVIERVWFSNKVLPYQHAIGSYFPLKSRKPENIFIFETPRSCEPSCLQHGTRPDWRYKYQITFYTILISVWKITSHRLRSNDKGRKWRRIEPNSEESGSFFSELKICAIQIPSFTWNSQQFTAWHVAASSKSADETLTEKRETRHTFCNTNQGLFEASWSFLTSVLIPYLFSSHDLYHRSLPPQFCNSAYALRLCGNYSLLAATFCLTSKFTVQNSMFHAHHYSSLRHILFLDTAFSCCSMDHQAVIHRTARKRKG